MFTHSVGSYLLIVIDNLSRRVCVQFTTIKNDMFESFKEWHTRLWNQIGTKLSVLRTNNSLEFGFRAV